MLVGMTLGLIVMAGVISCFVFLSRNLTRLQIQQKFESQARRTLLVFAQDARMAINVTAPTASSVTFILPAPASSPVSYAYDSATGTFTRTTPTDANQTLINLTDFAFTYYDVYGNPYPALTNYLIGIKQVSISFTAQSPASWNLTQPAFKYPVISSRIILRNKTTPP